MSAVANSADTSGFFTRGLAEADPEVARSIALAGVDAIIALSATSAPYHVVPRHLIPARAYENRLFFAFTRDLPCEVFPPDTGLIVADAYGAHLYCEAPEHRLPAATRKVMMARFGLVAARRINRLIDPQGHADIE